MSGGHELTEQVYAAKTDPEAADALIRQYMGFIRAEAAKFLHRAPVEGQDEELSIVLLAFYEAILGYEKHRGAFLAYASRGIRNRLIDHYRREKKHAKVVSLHEPIQDGDEDALKIDHLEDPTNAIEASHRRSAAKRSRNLNNAWKDSASHFPMWRITARGRSAHSGRARKCWQRPGTIRSIWTSSSRQKSFLSQRFQASPALTGKRWNAIADI